MPIQLNGFAWLPTTSEEYKRWWQEHYPHIPYGFCVCGCGEQTKRVKKTDQKVLRFYRQPQRYVKGHANRRSPVPWIRDSVTGCHIWQRATTKSRISHSRTVLYGQTHRDGTRITAHRFYYELAYGPVSDDKQVHHVCVEEGYGSTLCVNAKHLEAVTPSENSKRRRKSS